MRDFLYPHHYAGLCAIAYDAIAQQFKEKATNKKGGEIQLDFSSFLAEFPGRGRSALSELNIFLSPGEENIKKWPQEEVRKLLQRNSKFLSSVPAIGNWAWEKLYRPYRPEPFLHKQLLVQEARSIERAGYKLTPPIEILVSYQDEEWWDLTPEIRVPPQEPYQKW